MRTIFIKLLIMLTLWWPESHPEPMYTTLTGVAQGTTYQIRFKPGVQSFSRMEADSILRSIDTSLSLWKSGSLINRFNEADRSVVMDEHLRKVVSRALEVSRSSGGSFDITVKPLVDAWGFGVKGPSDVPKEERIRALLDCVGKGKIRISGRKLTKSSPCVQIDGNGIAQGYSVDVIADELEKRGIRDYLVELGGEIRVRGHGPTGTPWAVGIEDGDKTDAFGEPLVSITLQPGRGGITTAGSYRKFLERGGHHYSHVIDPRSGQPVGNGVIAVTVRARTAMDADAWDDALMVLGVDSSLHLLKRHPELQARFLFSRADGQVRDTATSGFFLPSGD